MRNKENSNKRERNQDRFSNSIKKMYQRQESQDLMKNRKNHHP